MKKYIMSFLFVIAFTMSVNAISYGGVWIEHFSVNMNVGNTRTFSIKPQNNGTVSATSWDGSRTYTGSVGVVNNNQIIIYSRNGNITLDRFDWSGEWTDNESQCYLRHVQRNVVEIIDMYSQQSEGQFYFVVLTPNQIQSGQLTLMRQSTVDTLNGLGIIGGFLGGLLGGD